MLNENLSPEKTCLVMSFKSLINMMYLMPIFVVRSILNINALYST